MKYKKYNPDINGEGASATNLEGLGFGANDLLLTKDINNNSNNNNTDDAKKAKALEAEKVAKEKADAEAAEVERLRLEKEGQQNSNNTPTVVEIDGKEFKLDANGNAVEEDGKIFKTKEELTQLSQEDELIPLVEEFTQKAGYTVLGEDGQPKKYEDSVEGIIEAAKDIADLKAKTTFQELLDSDADLKKFYEFRRKGGRTEDFINKTASSWSRIKYDDNNEQLNINAVITQLMKSGVSKEQAELTANMYKDTNNLKTFGKQAYTTLVQEEVAQEKAEKLAFEKAEQDEEKSIIAHWDNVKQVISKGAINNITIPESDRDAFFKYLSAPVNKQRDSQEMLDELTVEQSLQLKYLKFKKFDLSKLITAAVKTEKAASLRERFVTKKAGLGAGEGLNKDQYQKPAELNISLDSVLTGKSK